MDAYETTVAMMQNLPETDILVIKEFISRLLHKPEIKKEMYNPYKPLTREEITEQLAIAKKHSEEGKVMDAYDVSSNLRAKYGL